MLGVLIELFTHLASCKNRHPAPAFEKPSPEAVNRNCAMSGKAELLLISTPRGCGSSSSCRRGSVELGNWLAHSSHWSCPPPGPGPPPQLRSHLLCRAIPFACGRGRRGPNWLLEQLRCLFYLVLGHHPGVMSCAGLWVGLGELGQKHKSRGGFLTPYTI